MKNNKNIYRKMSVWAIGALFLGSAISTQADVVYSEDFNAGAVWSLSDAGGTITNTANYLDVTQSVGYKTIYPGYFSAGMGNLVIGEMVSLTFDVQRDAGSTLGALRLYLMAEGQNGGIGAQISFGQAAPTTLGWNASFQTGLGTAAPLYVDEADQTNLISTTGFENVGMSVTRLSANQLKYDVLRNGLSIGTSTVTFDSATEGTRPEDMYIDFRRIFIGTTAAATYQIDNVLVETQIVQEPSSFVSLLRVGGIMTVSAGDLLPGEFYDIESSPEVTGTWSYAQSFAATNSMQAIPVTNSGARLFWRLLGP